MIEFLSPEIRTQFHLLPLSRQLEVEAEAQRIASEGLIITVEWADAETSELCIRIDRQCEPLQV